MKKIVIAFHLMTLFFLFSGEALASVQCSGRLDNVRHFLVDGDNQYYKGENINTLLRFSLVGDSKTENKSRPLSVMLVMDRSGSMGEVNASYTDTKINDAKNALHAIVQRFVDLANPDNKVGLVIFDDAVELSSGLTNDYTYVDGQISMMTDRNATDIRDALDFAAKELNKTAPAGTKKIIILASDGQHNTPDGSTVSEAVDWHDNDDITAYTIGIEVNDSSQAMIDLENVAKNFGNKNDGKYYAAEDSAKLANAFKDVFEEITKFRAKDFRLSLEKADNTNITLLGTTDREGSLSPDGKTVSWNLGDVDSGYGGNLEIIYRAENFGVGIPLNKPKIKFSYSVNRDTCGDTEANVNVVEVDILCKSLFTYNCVQMPPDCTGKPCGTVARSTPTCVRFDTCGEPEYMDLLACQEQRATCAPKTKRDCNDLCGEKIEEYKEIAP